MARGTGFPSIGCVTGRDAKRKGIVPMSSLNVFDAYGKLADDIDPAAVEALPDNERDTLFACLAACRTAEAGENRRDAARKLVGELMRSHDAALAADIAANPPLTHAACLAEVSAAQRPGYKPKPAKADAKTRKALAAVIVELSEARAELTQAEATLRTLSAKRGDAIVAWMNAGPKITAESVHREMVAAEGDRKLKIANGELPAPVKAAPVFMSHLDQVLASGKVSVNKGNRRPMYPAR
jgi:hypothetical protein